MIAFYGDHVIKLDSGPRTDQAQSWLFHNTSSDGRAGPCLCSRMPSEVNEDGKDFMISQALLSD